MTSGRGGPRSPRKPADRAGARENLSVWLDIITLEGGRDWCGRIEEALKSKALQHFVLVSGGACKSRGAPRDQVGPPGGQAGTPGCRDLARSEMPMASLAPTRRGEIARAAARCPSPSAGPVPCPFFASVLTHDNVVSQARFQASAIVPGDRQRRDACQAVGSGK
jgi:hypothetical protein